VLGTPQSNGGCFGVSSGIEAVPRSGVETVAGRRVPKVLRGSPVREASHIRNAACFALSIGAAALIAGCSALPLSLSKGQGDVPAGSRGVRAQEHVLGDFVESDGVVPSGGLIVDKSGAFYGTTENGDGLGCTGFGCGTVFKLTPVSSAQYALAVIYQFKGDQDGGVPSGGLTADPSGALFGTTGTGGLSQDGYSGTVFTLTHSESGYSEHAIYSFTGGNDGRAPEGGVIEDGKRALYGVAMYNGDTRCECGTAYKLTRSGGGYTFSVIYRFQGGTDGSYPSTPLVADSRGNLYGMTFEGGSCKFNVDGCGTVFEIRQSHGTYIHVVLHAFSGGATDGVYPIGGLALDSSGNLYGATTYGGTCPIDSFGCGVAFELSPLGPTYSERVLYSFGSQGKDDGVFPNGSFTLAAGGVIYGTTTGTEIRQCYKRGVSCGTVFKLTPVGSSYTESVIFRFRDATQGNIPLSGLLAVGNSLFGETGFGGSPSCNFDGRSGCGTIFALSLHANFR